jgi:murein DD-endopeptidase MepM/ murein hydrolase activator NlpD
MPEDLDVDASLDKKHDGLIREMHEQVDNLDYASKIQLEGLTGVLHKLEEKRNILASTPSILPVTGWISSRFGYRTSPFTGSREMHKGVDIAAIKGSSIITTADGIITFAGSKGLLGNAIVVDHGHGISTRYAHCYKLLKKSGDVVKRGDLIARVGNTGRSTGPHLHYEVRVNNIQVNPERYILDFHAGSKKKSSGS